MRDVSLWNEVLGVEKTVFESVVYDQEQDLLVARVRPTKRAWGRCGLCLRPCPGYDGGAARWRWQDECVQVTGGWGLRCPARHPHLRRVDPVVWFLVPMISPGG